MTTIILGAVALNGHLARYFETINQWISSSSLTKPELISKYGKPGDGRKDLWTFGTQSLIVTQPDPFKRHLPDLPDKRISVPMPFVSYMCAYPDAASMPLFGNTKQVNIDASTQRPAGAWIRGLQILDYSIGREFDESSRTSGDDHRACHQLNELISNLKFSKGGKWFVFKDSLTSMLSRSMMMRTDSPLSLNCMYLTDRGGVPTIIWTEYFCIRWHTAKKINIETGREKDVYWFDLMPKANIENSIAQELFIGNLDELLRCKLMNNRQMVPWDKALKAMESEAKSEVVHHADVPSVSISEILSSKG